MTRSTGSSSISIRSESPDGPAPSGHGRYATMNRRFFIRWLGVAAGLLLLPLRALAARPKSAFESTSKDEALTELYGTSATTETEKIRIKAPDIAENGAVVPINRQVRYRERRIRQHHRGAQSRPPCRVVQAVRQIRRARLDPDQDGQDLSGARGRQGRRQDLSRQQGGEGHHRRLRRLNTRTGDDDMWD